MSENKIVSDFFSLQRPRSPVHVPIAFAADVKFHGVLYRVNFKATLGNFESKVPGEAGKLQVFSLPIPPPGHK